MQCYIPLEISDIEKTDAAFIWNSGDNDGDLNANVGFNKTLLGHIMEMHGVSDRNNGDAHKFAGFVDRFYVELGDWN